MEHGDPFFRDGQLAKSSSDSNLVQASNSSTSREAPSNPNSGDAGNEERPAAGPQLVVREEDPSLPIANVTRIMRRVLPQHAKITEEAKETTQKCVSEYIKFITSEANERCQREHRRTVTAKDLIWAMGKLGFNNYVEPLTLFLHRCRQNEVDRFMHRERPLPVQQRIANEGKPPPPPPPPPSPAYNESAFPVTSNPYQVRFDPMSMGGLYRDDSGDSGSGAGGSSSSSAMTNFDPLDYLKRD